MVCVGGKQVVLNCVHNQWLYVIVMSCTNFKVNLHSIVCLNVRELLARNRHHIWSLSDSDGIRTHNHLVHKRTLNCLAKLAKWLSCVVSTYLYGAFDCMLSSCHMKVSEWIYITIFYIYTPWHSGKLYGVDSLWKS